MVTIRILLAQNQAKGQKPGNISELSEMSDVARPTIAKIQDGKYDGVREATLQKAFKPLGYSVRFEVVVEEDQEQ